MSISMKCASGDLCVPRVNFWRGGGRRVAGANVSSPNQWVMPGGDYSVDRHSKLNQINVNNVKRLQVAWTMSTGTLRGHEGQPLVVGDTMYFESAYPNYVYAINLDDVERIAWKFAPKQNEFAPSVACCDLVNRGVAYADGKILATTLDGHVYALNAKTGEVHLAGDQCRPRTRPDHDLPLPWSSTIK